MKSFFQAIDRVNRKYRFAVSLTIAVIVFLFSYRMQTGAFTFMVSWIGFALCTLFFTWVTILIKHPEQTGAIAKNQDSSYFVIFFIVVTAAFISLFAIILLLHGLPTYSRRGLDVHIILSMVAVGLSWILIHTLFTIRYAHLYYTYELGAEQQKKEYDRGLIFPGSELPDFLDFAYFSFVLGMTFQTADVNIANRTFRRLALIHGFLSFVYNTAIIALSINIISGLIGK